MVHTVNFWRVLGSRIAAIRNLIWKRWVLHVRNVVRRLYIRKTKKGRRYYGCEGYPECDFMSWQKPSEKKCPKCGGYMLEKGNKLVCADEQCGYVEQKSSDN